MKRLVLIAALNLLITVPVIADEISDLIANAEQGSAASQALLGIKYAAGDGVSQNYSEAVKWHRMAAEQNWIDSQFILGYMYARGQGIPQDYVTAAKWYRMAAEQGHARGQSNLAILYVNGAGVPQDYSEAYV